jgi:hypothetical protein
MLAGRLYSRTHADMVIEVMVDGEGTFASKIVEYVV